MPSLPELLCFGAKSSKTKKSRWKRSEPAWVEYHRKLALERIVIDKDFQKGPKPLLPRPRTLTIGSDANGSAAAGADVQKPPVAALAQQTTAAFFTKLPPDIRLKIYTELLGNRTIHVEIEHCMRRPREPEYALYWRHYSLTQSLTYGDRDWPTTWSWWHCVCHRRDAAMSPLDDCVHDGLWHTARDHLRAEIAEPNGHEGCKLEIAMLFTCRQA